MRDRGIGIGKTKKFQSASLAYQHPVQGVVVMGTYFPFSLNFGQSNLNFSRFTLHVKWKSFEIYNVFHDWCLFGFAFG